MPWLPKRMSPTVHILFKLPGLKTKRHTPECFSIRIEASSKT